jgi:8-oxo-dGTP diphosphatase
LFVETGLADNVWVINRRSSQLQTVRVVASVIRRDARVLVCERPAHKRHGGMWEFPGGKLELGETILDAARRELAEELAVQVHSVGEQLFAIQDPGSQFVIEFHPVEITGEPTCLEHSSLAWVSYEDLVKLPLAPSDHQFALFLAERGPQANGE